MRRKAVRAGVAVTLVVCCFGWRVPEVAAQPMISGADSATPPSSSTQPEEVTGAIARFQAGDPDGAIKLLRDAAKKNPDLSPVQVMMARLYLRANVPAAAWNCLEKAVIEDPNDPDAYVMMADIALRERRITEADLAYQKAEALLAKFDKSAKRKDDLQAPIYNGLASVGEARENWAEAQRQLQAWLTIDPNNVNVMQRLARCLVQQNNLTDALAELKKAAKVDPKLLTPEAILARLCEQAGNRESARKYMIQALIEAPKDLNTRLAAARWAFETEQFAEALKQVEAAMKQDSKSFDAKILRGMIAAFQKDYRTAEGYFEQAHLQSPEDFRASNNLALALAEQKDRSKWGRAKLVAEENKNRFPKSAEALSTYGWVLYRLGQVEEADKYLWAAISGGSFSPDTAYRLARVELDCNRADKAKTLLETALKTPGPFAMRQEAKALLAQLGSK